MRPVLSTIRTAALVAGALSPAWVFAVHAESGVRHPLGGYAVKRPSSVSSTADFSDPCKEFVARLPNVKGTAGGVSFVLDEVLPASPAYRWTLNHTMAIDTPLALFPTHTATVG